MEDRMKTLLILACAGLAAGCTVDERPEDMAADEAKLATELAHYEQSGEPVSCVSLRQLRGNRSAGESAIIFDGIGDNIWVNRPPSGCPRLGFGRALKIKMPGNQLCRGEIAEVLDPGTGTSHGSCSLGDFTPYRRRG
jgi:hypothetical protein